MMHIETGFTGAKRQSWRAGNPRELLKSMISATPDFDREELFEAFCEKVAPKATPVLKSIIEYWFANNLHSLLAKPSTDSTDERKERKTTREEVAARATEIVKARVAAMVLLDLIQANGKALRDCTGKECTKAGGWLTQIGAEIKATEIVGKVLNEKRVRELYEQKGGVIK